MRADDAPRPNPVIAGFSPDPSVCRIGDTYHLVTSTFEYVPGLPVYRSTDLATWTQVGNVATRNEQLRVENAHAEGGVFAPTIRVHDDVFHVITTVVPSRGNVVYTATDPAGPWSDGLELPGITGIDPDLVWDDAGRCYVTYAGADFSSGEVRMLGIVQAQVDLATGERLTDPESMWQGTGLRFPEGPHVFRRGKYWYLVIAEGGTERGHAVSIARGPSPSGPWEGCPDNPILTQAGRQSPIQSTGHSDLFEREDGSWAIVFLGVRPLATEQRFAPLGRETFLADIEWVEDWPVVGPVELGPPQSVREELAFAAADALDPGWLSPRLSAAGFTSLTERPGWLRVFGPDQPSGGLDAADAAFVGRRQRHHACTVTATVDATHGVGGLALRSNDEHHVSIVVDAEGTVRARARVSGIEQSWSVPIGAPVARLALETRPPTGGFGDQSYSDRIVLQAGVAGGELVDVAEVDGRYFSMEVGAFMTGRVIGVVAESGTVDVTDVVYEGADSPRA